MLLETFAIQNLYNEKKKKEQPLQVSRKNTNIKLISVIVLGIFVSFISGSLSWKCNKNATPIIRSINLLVSLLFSSLYIIYYFLYRILLGVPCYSE
jgi:hypothetical protein